MYVYISVDGTDDVVCQVHDTTDAQTAIATTASDNSGQCVLHR